MVRGEVKADDGVSFSCYRVVPAARLEEESARSVQRQHYNRAAAQSRQDVRTCGRDLETTQGDGERSRQSPVSTGSEVYDNRVTNKNK